MRHSTALRLRRTFADVIGALLTTAATAATATSVVALTGCGGSTSGPGGGGGGVVVGGGVQPNFTSACTPDVNVSFLKGLKASPAIDGAVLRTEQAFLVLNAKYSGGGVTGDVPPEGGDLWKASNGESVGTLCSKASNPATCLEKVQGYRVLPPTREACAAQYPSSEYTSMQCQALYFLYTRGDEIGVARTPDETRALIGTVDTVPEAIWVASEAKLRPSCGGPGSDVKDSQYRTTSDGGYDLILVDDQCGQTVFEVTVHVDPAGQLTETSRKDLKVTHGCAVAGRRPDGLRTDGPATEGSDSVGEHFAAMASLEAASVVAFRRLHRQLAAHGAPAHLLKRVRTAARDEIRHARATRALAIKYGVTPIAPRIDACHEAPSLFGIALENAREGCVRETYGALVAHLQVQRAADADVRASMEVIADEETEHAALSWDIAAWIETQLGEPERKALARERRDAVATLARDLAAPVDVRVQQASGIPSPADALRMLEGLHPTFLAA